MSGPGSSAMGDAALDPLTKRALDDLHAVFHQQGSVLDRYYHVYEQFTKTTGVFPLGRIATHLSADLVCHLAAIADRDLPADAAQKLRTLCRGDIGAAKSKRPKSKQKQQQLHKRRSPSHYWALGWADAIGLFHLGRGGLTKDFLSKLLAAEVAGCDRDEYMRVLLSEATTRREQHDRKLPRIAKDQRTATLLFCPIDAKNALATLSQRNGFSAQDDAAEALVEEQGREQEQEQEGNEDLGAELLNDHEQGYEQERREQRDQRQHVEGHQQEHVQGHEQQNGMYLDHKQRHERQDGNDYDQNYELWQRAGQQIQQAQDRTAQSRLPEDSRTAYQFEQSNTPCLSENKRRRGQYNSVAVSTTSMDNFSRDGDDTRSVASQRSFGSEDPTPGDGHVVFQVHEDQGVMPQSPSQPAEDSQSDSSASIERGLRCPAPVPEQRDDVFLLSTQSNQRRKRRHHLFDSDGRDTRSQLAKQDLYRPPSLHLELSESDVDMAHPESQLSNRSFAKNCFRLNTPSKSSTGRCTSALDARTDSTQPLNNLISGNPQAIVATTLPDVPAVWQELVDHIDDGCVTSFLEPKSWVRANIVDFLLHALVPSSYHVVSSSATCASLRPFQVYRPLKDTANSALPPMIVPMCDNRHWVLGILTPGDATAVILDSLLASTSNAWAERMRAFHKRLPGCSESVLQVDVDHAAAQQRNGFSCGVYTVVNALLRATNVNLFDSRIDDLTARYLLGAVLYARKTGEAAILTPPAFECPPPGDPPQLIPGASLKSLKSLQRTVEAEIERRKDELGAFASANNLRLSTCQAMELAFRHAQDLLRITATDREAAAQYLAAFDKLRPEAKVMVDPSWTNELLHQRRQELANTKQREDQVGRLLAVALQASVQLRERLLREQRKVNIELEG